MHGWQGSRTWVRASLVLILSVLLIGFAGVSGSWEPDQAVAAPAAQAACSPRPRVQVNTTNSGADTLNITVSSSPTNSGPANVIQRIQFGIARNATIDVPSGPTASSGNFSQTYGGSTTQVTFTVRRQGGAMTVPFTVVDLCGDWPTFVGGGTQVGAPTATPTPTTVPALSYPAPGSRAYALSASTPHVAVIDTATNQLITTIKYADVGGIQASDLIGAPNVNPPPILLNPSGREVYVFFRGDPGGTARLVAIDTASNQVIKNLSFQGIACNQSMLLSSDGQRLLLDCQQLLVVDTSTFSVSQMPNELNGTALRRIALDASGQFAYVPYSGGVAKVQLSTRAIVSRATLSTGSVDLDYDSTLNRIYSYPGIWVLDATTLAPLPLGTGGRLDPGPGLGNLFALTSDGLAVAKLTTGCPLPNPCPARIDVFNTTSGTLSGTQMLDVVTTRDISVHPTQPRIYAIVDISASEPSTRNPFLLEVDLTNLPAFHYAGPSSVGPDRFGPLGFSDDGSRVFVAAGRPFTSNPVGSVEVYDASLATMISSFETRDGGGQPLCPVAAVTSSSQRKMYISLIDAPGDSPSAAGGVLFWNTQTSQPITFLPLFDVAGVAILP